jgi:hypothetical protein
MPRKTAKEWGYDFGCEGLKKYATVMAEWDISEDTIDRMAARGQIRVGVLPGHIRKGPKMVCARSLRECRELCEREVATA